MPTNSAYLLFAADDPHYNVHIGRFKTPSVIIDDKMVSGTLFEMVDEAMRIIVSHLKFSFKFNITATNTRRTEIPEYPLAAIRELLLNAVVHRNYQSPTDVQIKIFDSKIDFFNPVDFMAISRRKTFPPTHIRLVLATSRLPKPFILQKLLRNMVAVLCVLGWNCQIIHC